MNAYEFVKNKSFDEIVKISTQEPYFFKVQENGDLYQLSFTEESDFSLPVVREMNGVIFEKETNRVIHHAFEKTYDCFFTPTPGLLCLESDPYVLGFDHSAVRIEHFTEGSLIRVYWYENEWNIGTARNINAALSHWGSDKSFKELFLEAMEYQEENFEGLDKNYCYSYILQHPESKICVDVSIPYCSMINKVNLESLEEERFTDSFSVEKPISEIFSTISNVGCKLTDNYLVYLPDGSKVKVLNYKYKAVQKAINDNPSIKWVYLESIKNGTYPMIRDAFKNDCHKFDDIDNAFDEVSGMIHLAYIKRNIKREQNFEVPKRYERTVAQLHGYYKRTKNIITLDTVRDKLLDLDTKLLYYVLAI